jgi:imidazolonepropionase
MAILVIDVTVATMVGGCGLTSAAAVAIQGDKIVWVGRMADIPTVYADLPHHNGNNGMITPGLIDCHSHVVFAGDHAAEFEMRPNSASYADVALAGGGIFSQSRRHAAHQRLSCWPSPCPASIR